MFSSVLPLLVVVAVVCWVVLPAAVLVAAAVGPRRPPVDPVWVRRCQGTREGDEACWVPAEAGHCPKHEPGPWAQGHGEEIFIV